MKQNGKRWISLALVLCMVLTLLPMTAWAANWDVGMNWVYDNATTLTGENTWNIQEGCTLTIQNSITIAAGATLTLTGSGTIQAALTDVGTAGQLFIVEGTLVIDGVTIRGPGVKVGTNGYSAISVSGNATCIMNSGVIEKFYRSSYGAAVSTTNHITSTSETVATGGVFTMTGGTIRDNTCVGTSYTSVVCANGGTVNIGGSAVIEGNTDTQAKGVIVNGRYSSSKPGTVNITGGTIRSASGKPAIYAVNKTTTTISGAPTIRGGIYLAYVNESTAPYLYLPEALQIPLSIEFSEDRAASQYENKAIVGGSDGYTITEADMSRLWLENSGWYLYQDTANHQAKLTQDTSGNLTNYYPILIPSDDDGLTVDLYQNGQKIGSLSYDETAGGYIGSVPAGTYDVYVDGQDTGNTITVSADSTTFDSDVLLAPHVHPVDSNMGDTTFDPLSSLETTLGPGDYYLTKNLTNGTNDHITISGDVTLCLNGKTLDLNSKHIIVPTGSSLTLCDCSDTGSGDSGKITGQNYTNGNENGQGAVLVNGGTFTMYSGAISDNIANAGGVYVNGGIFNMSGGFISGNTAKVGGGVYVYSGTFDMSGGAISGNEAPDYGDAGVYVGSAGSFTMSGGAIIDNVCTTNSGCGGVKVEGSFTMSGGEISGNQTSSTFYGGGVHVAQKD